MRVSEKVEIKIGDKRLFCSDGLWTWCSTPVREMSKQEAIAFLTRWWAECMRLISARLRLGFKRGSDPMIEHYRQLADDINTAIETVSSY